MSNEPIVTNITKYPCLLVYSMGFPNLCPTKTWNTYDEQTAHCLGIQLYRNGELENSPYALG